MVRLGRCRRPRIVRRCGALPSVASAPGDVPRAPGRVWAVFRVLAFNDVHDRLVVPDVVVVVLSAFPVGDAADVNRNGQPG
jgi:hypothetical protein